jgi:hypothetical protein
MKSYTTRSATFDEEILSFQIHAKSETLKLIRIPYLKPMQQLTGALITFFHVKNSDLIKIVDS